ncbi:hypothetical protein Syun_004257 [Stephania yunnanensis]|uniref:Uncharacterized protein n=1 Tax=Stephania yunnanensis TaxID=152371 RepID=A0AAP0L3M5_9MAGN
MQKLHITEIELVDHYNSPCLSSACNGGGDDVGGPRYMCLICTESLGLRSRTEQQP